MYDGMRQRVWWRLRCLTMLAIYDDPGTGKSERKMAVLAGQQPGDDLWWRPKRKTPSVVAADGGFVVLASNQHKYTKRGSKPTSTPLFNVELPSDRQIILPTHATSSQEAP
jgi:hypothetical protein